jgi:hypothetical protein
MALKHKIRSKYHTISFYGIKFFIVVFFAVCVTLWNKLNYHKGSNRFNSFNRAHFWKAHHFNQSNILIPKLLINIRSQTLWSSEFKKKNVFGYKKSQTSNSQHGKVRENFEALEMCPPVSPKTGMYIKI